MQTLNSFLIDWIVRFLENKDVIRKNISKIEKNEKGFVVHYKNGVKNFVVEKNLNREILDKIKQSDTVKVITINNKENTKFIIDKWKELAKFSSLNIYLINPFSKADKVWIIHPYIHDKICDSNSLELGIKTMAEMVEAIDEQKLEQLIKLKTKESGQ